MTNRQIFATALLIMGAFCIGLWTLQYLKSRRPEAGLKVVTTPPVEVIVNGINLGMSPIDKLFRPGETKLTIGSFTTTTHLYSKVYTVVNRDLGLTEADSAGEIITLEPAPNSTTFTVVSTYPDAISVSVDGLPAGLTPIPPTIITPGTHNFIFSSPGFTTRQVQALASSGRALRFTVKLAGSIPKPHLPSTSPVITKYPESIPKVEILDTPTGFLRVRLSPDLDSTEISRVTPGNNYPLLETAPDWYKIEYAPPATSSGWISAQYAKPLGTRP